MSSKVSIWFLTNFIKTKIFIYLISSLNLSLIETSNGLVFFNYFHDPGVQWALNEEDSVCVADDALHDEHPVSTDDSVE